MVRGAGAHLNTPPSAPTQGVGPAPRHGAGGACTCAGDAVAPRMTIAAAKPSIRFIGVTPRQSEARDDNTVAVTARVSREPTKYSARPTTAKIAATRTSAHGLLEISQRPSAIAPAEISGPAGAENELCGSPVLRRMTGSAAHVAMYATRRTI